MRSKYPVRSQPRHNAADGLQILIGIFSVLIVLRLPAAQLHGMPELAQQDLRQRFAAQFGAAVPAPEFRTVHGFCAVVLAEYARLTGKTLFQLMDKPGENARLLSQIALETLHMRPSDLQLRELQRKLSAQRNRMDDNGSAGLHDFLRVYTERKIALRAMDYDDLLEYAFRALTAHPSLLAAYRRRFLYVQVDEAQDLSPLQHKIIDCIAQTGSLMMVGDEDQSIYGFRAANPDALFSFSTQYPDAKVMTLTQNYRSTPEIVRAANGLIARNAARHPKQMCTARPGGPAPQRVCVRSRIAQYALLESMAMEASPFIFPRSLSQSMKKEASVTSGMATASGATFITAASASAPNPTWERPSPIMEKRRSTRFTPSSAMQSEISTPPIKALQIKP